MRGFTFQNIAQSRKDIKQSKDWGWCHEQTFHQEWELFPPPPPATATVGSTNPIWRPRHSLYFITFHFLSSSSPFPFYLQTLYNILYLNTIEKLTLICELPVAHWWNTLSKVRWAHAIHFIIGYRNSWNAIRNDTFW